jgi:hypothetical protein
MDIYTIYIYFIIIIKLIFIGLSINMILLRKRNEQNTYKYIKLSYWKSRIEFIFISAMALLLIILFNPLNKKNSNSVCIDKETRILLFLFGIILILTSKWDLFFATSPLFNEIQIAL